MRSNRFCAFLSKACLSSRRPPCRVLWQPWSMQPQSKPTSAAAPAQMQFATPQLAAEALVKATADYDVPALMNILGPDGRDLISSADAVRDKKAAAEAAAKATRKHTVVIDPKNSKRAILSIGERRLARSDSHPPETREMVFRYQGGPRGDSVPAHRRKRTGRHRHLPRLCRSPERVCADDPRQFRRESIRAEDYQHAGKTGWAGLAKSRRQLGRSRRRRSSERSRRRLRG